MLTEQVTDVTQIRLLDVVLMLMLSKRDVILMLLVSKDILQVGKPDGKPDGCAEYDERNTIL